MNINEMKLKDKIFISMLMLSATFIFGWISITILSFRVDELSLERLMKNHEFQVYLEEARAYGEISIEIIGRKIDHLYNNTENLSKKIVSERERLLNDPQVSSLEIKRFVDLLLHEIHNLTNQEIDKSKASHKRRRSLAMLFFIIFITLLTSIFLWVKATIVGHLEEIELEVNQISRGFYDIDLDSEKLGDFSHLAESFNKMGKSIRANMATLLEQKEHLHKEVVERSAIEGDLKRLRGIIDQTDDFIATIDLDHKITFVNEGGRRLINRSAREFKDATLADVYPQWSLKRIIDEGFPIAISERIWKGEVAIFNRDGNEIPMSQTLLVHYDEQGNISHMSAIARDISKQKIAEEEILRYQNQLEELVDRRTLELQSREYEYRQLYNNNSVGLWSIDFETKVFNRINEKAAATFGWESSDEAIGEKIFLTPSFNREEVDNFWDKLKSFDHVTGFDFSFMRDDNSISYFMVEATVFRRKGVIEGTVIDITEKKEAELRLMKAQSDLIQTARMAGRSEIVSSILHNVGNVLNSVGIGVEVSHEIIRKLRTNDLLQLYNGLMKIDMSSVEKGDKYVEYLGVVTNELLSERERLLEEFGDLRNHLEHIGKIIRIQQSMGKLGGVTERIAVNGIVEEAIEIVFSGQSRGDINIVKKYDRALEQLSSIDRHKVMQIVINLLSNAKYALYETKIDSKQITIETNFENNNEITICVKDNGIGIDAKSLEQIFAFGYTTKKDGHGFGLHSSHNVAKELNGSLYVASDGVGKGATFTLTLPFCDPQLVGVA